MHKTPTQRILECLQVYKDKGLEFISSGGSGFILPRYWIFKWRGETVCCCKTKSLKELLHRVAMEYAEKII